MVKKRAIVSYEKLTLDQKKKFEEAFPEGFGNAMTKVNTPTGEVLDAVLWETEEMIYLVKLVKVASKSVSIDDEDGDDDVIDDLGVKLDEDEEEEEEDDDSYDDDDDSNDDEEED